MGTSGYTLGTPVFQRQNPLGRGLSTNLPSVWEKLKQMFDDNSEIQVTCACDKLPCGSRDRTNKKAPFPYPYPADPTPLTPGKPPTGSVPVGSGAGILLPGPGGQYVAYVIAGQVIVDAVPLSGTGALAYQGIATEMRAAPQETTGQPPAWMVAAAEEFGYRLVYARPGPSGKEEGKPEGPKGAGGREEPGVGEPRRGDSSAKPTTPTTPGTTPSTPPPADPGWCQAFYGPVESSGDKFITGEYEVDLQATYQSISFDGKMKVKFDASMTTKVVNTSVRPGRCDPPPCTNEDILIAAVKVTYAGSLTVTFSAGFKVPVIGEIRANVGYNQQVGCNGLINVEVPCGNY